MRREGVAFVPSWRPHCASAAVAAAAAVVAFERDELPVAARDTRWDPPSVSAPKDGTLPKGDPAPCLLLLLLLGAPASELLPSRLPASALTLLLAGAAAALSPLLLAPLTLAGAGGDAAAGAATVDCGLGPPIVLQRSKSS
jgi:hypothetical protein